MGRGQPHLMLLVGGTIVTALVATGEARAHRLEADYRVLPGRRVQIESWFDLTGDSPKGAAVQVYGPTGRLLAGGRLSDKGIFVFPYTKAERLKVVISAGAGHRKELEVPEAVLALDPADSQVQVDSGPGMEQPDTAPIPLADRSPRVSLKDVVMGVGFVLALAAFMLGMRNARRLKELSREKTFDGPR